MAAGTPHIIVVGGDLAGAYCPRPSRTTAFNPFVAAGKYSMRWAYER